LAVGRAPLAFFPISIYLGFPKIKKSGSPLRGTAKQDVSSSGISSIGAGRRHDLERASGGQWPVWKQCMRTIVQASGGEERIVA
jgi:hypothetical protein